MHKAGRKQGASATSGPSKRSHGKLPVFESDLRFPTLETVSLADPSPPESPASGKSPPTPPGPFSGQVSPSPVQHSGPPSVLAGEASRLETASPPLSTTKVKVTDFDDPVQFQRAVNGRFEALVELQRDFDTRERMEEFEHRVEEAAQVRFRREYGFQAPMVESADDALGARNFRPRSQMTNVTDDWSDKYLRRRYPSFDRQLDRYLW